MAPRWWSGAGKHESRGEELFHKGQFRQAIEEFSKSIEIDPKHAETYLLRSLAYRNLGQSEDADADFDNAISFNPRRVYRRAFKIGEEYFKQGRLSDALELFNIAVRVSSESAEAYIYRGACFRELKQYENAIEDIDKAINLNPKKVFKNGFESGEAFFEEGRLNDAIEMFSIAARVSSDDFETYLYRGASYRELGHYENAIADFDKVLSLEPRSAYAYTVCGSSYFSLGEFRKAMESLEVAVNLDPEEPLAVYCRGVLFSRLKMYDEAIAHFNRVLEPNPAAYLSTYPNRRSNAESAKRKPLQFDNVIALKHDYAQAYCERGLAYMESYNEVEAVSDFTKAIELNPEHAAAFIWRGSCYEKLDSQLKAFEDYDKAIDLSVPTSTAVAYVRRATLYAEFKEFSKAAADLEQAEALGYPSKDIQWVRRRIGI